MAHKTWFTYLVILCLLQYYVARTMTIRETRSETIADSLSKRSIERRDTAAVENIRSRSQQLKARMSDAIQHVESEVQQRSQVLAQRLQEILAKVIDTGTRMLEQRLEAQAAENGQ